MSIPENVATVKGLQNLSVASIDLKTADLEELVDLAAAKKTKMDFAKAELDVVNAEIQSRAVQFQEDRHIKFTSWYGSGKAAADVTVAQSFDILNIVKLRELLGDELVNLKVKIKPAEVKYDVDADFKRALTAIILDDYERNLTIPDVVDRAGWCAEDPKSRASLLKKLKGDYKKDKKAVLAALNMSENEIDVDAELYLIYQIRNWTLICAYFDEEHFEEAAAAIKRCVTVDETVKIALKVG